MEFPKTNELNRVNNNKFYFRTKKTSFQIAAVNSKLLFFQWLPIRFGDPDFCTTASVFCVFFLAKEICRGNITALFVDTLSLPRKIVLF